MDDEYVAELPKLIQPQEHVCTETCDIVVPKIYIYAKDGKEVIHFQFQPKQPWMDDTTLVRRVHSIYVCKATRSVHRCHANCCMPKITNSEHCLVCPISGLQWDNSTEEIKSWKLAAKCAPAMTVDKAIRISFCATKTVRSPTRPPRSTFTCTHSVRRSTNSCTNYSSPSHAYESN